jgi:hypothetical protein
MAIANKIEWSNSRGEFRVIGYLNGEAFGDVTEVDNNDKGFATRTEARDWVENYNSWLADALATEVNGVKMSHRNGISCEG